MNVRAAVLLLICCLPALAQAQLRPSFNLDRLSLNPGARDSLLLQTGDGLYAGELRATLAGQYQSDPLLYREVDGGVAALVGNRTSLHLAIAWGVTDWLEVGLHLPEILAQSGDSITGFDPVRSHALGSPSFQGRFTLLREARGALLDLGLTAGVTVPFGARGAMAREPAATFRGAVGAGKALGSFLRLGVEAGATLREEVVISPHALEPDDAIGNELHGGIVLSTLGDGLRGEVNAIGYVPTNDTPASLELLGGVRYPFAPVEAFAIAGPGFGDTPGTPDFRFLAGIALAPGARQARAAQVRAAPACEADRSCPDMDMDGDFVTNRWDQCPTVAGEAELRGCPAEKPDEPAVVAEAAAEEPAVAEQKPVAPAPVTTPAPTPREEKLAETVQFRLDSAAIDGDFAAFLDQLAARVRADQRITQVRIEGHTDTTGPREFNVVLSELRAQSVRTYLIRKGVEPERVVATGHGPDRPAAGNDSRAGREKNRRVEFITIRIAP